MGNLVVRVATVYVPGTQQYTARSVPVRPEAAGSSLEVIKMRIKRFARWTRASLVWVALIAGGTAALAQVDTGSIVGTVTDSGGAVVSGAMVSTVNEETAAKLTARTGEDGRYVFTPLQIGTYSVVVEAGGFKKATIQHVHLNIQQQALVNVSLQLGTVTENVEVNEAPELMQTQSGSVGQVIEEKTIEDLPLNGRDYTMLVLLTP